MKVNRYIGYMTGLSSGVFWAIDTVLISYIMSKFNFESSYNGLWLSLLLMGMHDLFSFIWVTFYHLKNGEVGKIIYKCGNENVFPIIVAALLGAPIGMTCYVLSIYMTSAAQTSVISTLYPIVGMVVTLFIRKINLAAHTKIGTVSAVLFAILPYVLTTYKFNIGIVFAFICAIGWGMECVVCSLCFEKSWKPSYVLQIRQFVSALLYTFIIIPLLIIFTDVSIYLLQTYIFSIIVASFFGTISYLCYYNSIYNIGAVKSMALNMTYSVWSIFLEVIVLFGNLHFINVLSGVGVLISALITAISYEDWKKLFKRGKL